jgi:hypothetical protein
MAPASSPTGSPPPFADLQVPYNLPERELDTAIQQANWATDLVED